MFKRELEFIEIVKKDFKIDTLHGRTRPLPQIKQVLSHILYYDFGMYNKSSVGVLLGQNHATIIHNLKQIEMIKQPTDVYYNIWQKMQGLYYAFNNPSNMDIKWELQMRKFN